MRFFFISLQSAGFREMLRYCGYQNDTPGVLPFGMPLRFCNAFPGIIFCSGMLHLMNGCVKVDPILQAMIATYSEASFPGYVKAPTYAAGTSSVACRRRQL